ncbi:MAG: M48 family metalloprotease [Betaproteobacteria bacterium]|nr:M48 family metalloprotease [Betaproteobacteria bacterium]
MRIAATFLASLGCAVLLGAVVAGCSQQQMDAFVKNSGGLDNLTKTVKEAFGSIDEPQEIEMGHGMAETLLGARPLLDDPALQRYVNEVGGWVAAQSDRPELPWHFGVNDSEHVNAFAAPGGYVIVTRGMMEVLQNEAELAGVLGHEIGHVIRKHHLHALQKGAWMTLLGSGLSASAAGKPSEDLVKALVGPTKELYSRGLDRDDEFDADRIGVVLATRAGYDPWGLPAALQTLAKINPDDPYMALLLKTHPNPGQRLDRLAQAMGTGFDRYADGRDNADRFRVAVRAIRPPAAQ